MACRALSPNHHHHATRRSKVFMEEESAEDILQRLHDVQHKMAVLRKIGRHRNRCQSRLTSSQGAPQLQHQMQAATASFNNTSSYVSEPVTPPSLSSCELSSRNFSCTFTEERVIKLEPMRQQQVNQSRPMHSLTDVSEIKRTSNSSLHQRMSSSRLLDGPLNSSMAYPTHSTPSPDRLREVPREELSACVKQLAFDSDNSIDCLRPRVIIRPSLSTSSVSSLEPSCISSRASLQPSSTSLHPSMASSVNLQPSATSYISLQPTVASSASLQPAFSHASLQARNIRHEAYSYNSLPRPACEGSESGFQEEDEENLDETFLDLDMTVAVTDPSLLHCTVDSDATAFLEAPLCARPITNKTQPSKYRQVARQLRRIGRQIHKKGAKALRLETLAVL